MLESREQMPRAKRQEQVATSLRCRFGFLNRSRAGSCYKRNTPKQRSWLRASLRTCSTSLTCQRQLDNHTLKSLMMTFLYTLGNKEFGALGCRGTTPAPGSRSISSSTQCMPKRRRRRQDRCTWHKPVQAASSTKTWDRLIFVWRPCKEGPGKQSWRARPGCAAEAQCHKKQPTSLWRILRLS